MAYITVAELRRHLGINESCTFTADADANTLTLASVPFATKAVKTGTPVEVSTTGTLPAGLAASTVYYVIPVADQTIKLAASSADAGTGTAIDITSAGTGTHTITLADDETDELTDAITDAETFIESYTNRLFDVSSDTTRYYLDTALDEDDSTILYMDTDLYSVTSIANGDEDATAIASTEYWLLPRNSGPPYNAIQMKSNSDYYWEWDTDCWVGITGKFGYSATPPGDVKRACLRLAAYFYKQKDAPFETTAIPEAGVISVPSGIPAGVMRILDRYKRCI